MRVIKAYKSMQEGNRGLKLCCKLQPFIKIRLNCCPIHTFQESPSPARCNSVAPSQRGAIKQQEGEFFFISYADEFLSAKGIFLPRISTQKYCRLHPTVKFLHFPKTLKRQKDSFFFIPKRSECKDPVNVQTSDLLSEVTLEGGQ